MFKIILALLVTLAPTLAIAGDASNFISIGFSENGKYYAFAQTGITDGAGSAYANVAVVDVEKNTMLSSRTVFLDNDDDLKNTESMALAKAMKKTILSRYGIRRNENLGKTLLAHLPTDFSSYSRSIFSFDFWPEGGAMTSIPKYEVLINTKDGIDTTEGKYCSDFIGKAPQLLKLSIVGLENTNGATTVLQNDQALPKIRQCVDEYKVQRVISYKGGLVVALSYSGIGFEGPDIRQMVVTGKLGN